jgi:hypothetical protein
MKTCPCMCVFITKKKSGAPQGAFGAEAFSAPSVPAFGALAAGRSGSRVPAFGTLAPSGAPFFRSRKWKKETVGPDAAKSRDDESCLVALFEN